jgi:FkbM family methyltransferase
LDIGANEGNVSNVIHYISPKTQIFAFDPLKGKAELIKDKIKSKNLVVESLALSDHTGTQIFHEYEFHAASSFIKPDPSKKDKYMKIAKSYPVKMTTLDNYFKNKKIKKPIFIKMDVEGTENLIIKGGKETIKNASFIVIETSFIQVRKNQCQFDEIYDQLTKLGFEYKGSMFESFFYPVFGAIQTENSIFIKKGKLLNYLD